MHKMILFAKFRRVFEASSGRLQMQIIKLAVLSGVLTAGSLLANSQLEAFFENIDINKDARISE